VKSGLVCLRVPALQLGPLQRYQRYQRERERERERERLSRTGFQQMT
jgi:hypothetical protein